MSTEIKNAIIENAIIDIGDRGLLTAWVFLDYGGSAQGFGGYSLYLPKSWANHSTNINYAGHFIMRVMQVAGVGKWHELKGKTVRVKCTNSHVSALGHIVKEDWFNPSEDFSQFNESK